MTTARTIIEDCLTFRLNRLSVGETADADTLDVCLRALNALVDEINGGRSLLYREALTASGSAISTASASLGTAWSTIAPGTEILGATYASGGQDSPMWPLTMEQYQAISDKTTAGAPEFYAHDGLTLIYFWPVPSSYVITLRTKIAASDFADVDADYTLPKGYRAALADMLAERLAPTMAPTLYVPSQRAAAAARLRLMAQNVSPAIVDTCRPADFDIQRGW